MGLFKSEEEKQQIQEHKQQALLEKYGLGEISKEYIDSVKKISDELVGTGLMETGMALGGANEKDMLRIQVVYQRAIIEQNFIIIRMLNKISNK